MEKLTLHMIDENNNVSVETTLNDTLLLTFQNGFKYPVSKEEGILLANAIKAVLEKDGSLAPIERKTVTA